MKVKNYFVIGSVVFYAFIFVSLYGMEKEEKKKMFLSNVDVDDALFFEHWRGLEKQALEILEQQEYVDGTIKVKRAGELIAKFDIQKKRVVMQFPEGQLKLAYEAFKLRLESKDEEHNIGTLCGGKYMPVENGKRLGQRDSDEVRLAKYEQLSKNVGSVTAMLQDSEDMALLRKRKRKCCCILN